MSMNRFATQAMTASVFAMGWIASGAMARAANPAADAASDAAYDDGWQAGDNGGGGFGPWILATPFDNPATGGFFIGDSANNGDAPSGDVNTAGESFGLYANSGDVATAFRSFTGGPLVPGQTFRASMDNGFVQPNRVVSFSLLPANGSGGLSFAFVGGRGNYVVGDASGIHDTGVPFTDDGLTVGVLYAGGNTYSLSINGGSPLAGTFVGGDLSSFQLQNFDAGAGSSHDAFFNSVQVTGIPEPCGAALAAAGAMALAMRRRNLSRKHA